MNTPIKLWLLIFCGIAWASLYADAPQNRADLLKTLNDFIVAKSILSSAAQGAAPVYAGFGISSDSKFIYELGTLTADDKGKLTATGYTDNSGNKVDYRQILDAGSARTFKRLVAGVGGTLFVLLDDGSVKKVTATGNPTDILPAAPTRTLIAAGGLNDGDVWCVDNAGGLSKGTQSMLTGIAAVVAAPAAGKVATIRQSMALYRTTDPIANDFPLQGITSVKNICLAGPTGMEALIVQTNEGLFLVRNPFDATPGAVVTLAAKMPPANSLSMFGTIAVVFVKGVGYFGRDLAKEITPTQLAQNAGTLRIKDRYVSVDATTGIVKLVTDSSAAQTFVIAQSGSGFEFTTNDGKVLTTNSGDGIFDDSGNAVRVNLFARVRANMLKTQSSVFVSTGDVKQDSPFKLKMIIPNAAASFVRIKTDPAKGDSLTVHTDANAASVTEGDATVFNWEEPFVTTVKVNDVSTVVASAPANIVLAAYWTVLQSKNALTDDSRLPKLAAAANELKKYVDWSLANRSDDWKSGSREVLNTLIKNIKTLPAPSTGLEASTALLFPYGKEKSFSDIIDYIASANDPFIGPKYIQINGISYLKVNDPEIKPMAGRVIFTTDVNAATPLIIERARAQDGSIYYTGSISKNNIKYMLVGPTVAALADTRSADNSAILRVATAPAAGTSSLSTLTDTDVQLQLVFEKVDTGFKVKNQAANAGAYLAQIVGKGGATVPSLFKDNGTAWVAAEGSDALVVKFLDSVAGISSPAPVSASQPASPTTSPAPASQSASPAPAPAPSQPVSATRA